MKCLEIRQNKLFITEKDDPKPKRGEVLIRVHSAAINRTDILQRKGIEALPAGFNDIPGQEVAGDIVEIHRGSNKNRKGMKPLKVKDRVIALIPFGGYAELCIAPAELCMHIPKEMDYAEASAIPQAFIVAWRNLTNVAKLKKGETVLIHAGSSGMGTAAIQIAKALGARVITTAGTDEKCKMCEKLGADKAINYRDTDFVEATMSATKGKGVEVVFDMVGGDYIPRNIEVLKKGGRHVSIANMRGDSSSIDFKRVMEKEISLTGSLLSTQSLDEMKEIIKDTTQNVLPLMRKLGFFGKLFGHKELHPVIDKEFLLSDGQNAHDYIDRELHFGKVILRII